MFEYDCHIEGTTTEENAVLWNGHAVGIDCGTHIAWFPSASLEAIEEIMKTWKAVA